MTPVPAGRRVSRVRLQGIGNADSIFVWDREGAQRSTGHFFDLELGLRDGAYKVRRFCVVPV